MYTVLQKSRQVYIYYRFIAIINTVTIKGRTWQYRILFI